LLVNVYMNEFDYYIKQALNIKYYIRYADDFVICSQNRDYLVSLIPKIQHYLREALRLELHPKKVSISTIASGVDFLGWVHFPNHRVLRTSTEKRMIKKLDNTKNSATVQSYLGLLQHGNTIKLQEKVYTISTAQSID